MRKSICCLVLLSLLALTNPCLAQLAPTPGEAVAEAAGCRVYVVQCVGTSTGQRDCSQAASWSAFYDRTCTGSQITAGNAALSAYDFAAFMLHHK